MSAKSASGVEDLFIASASVGIPTAAERLEESITNSVSNTQECTGVVSGVVIYLQIMEISFSVWFFISSVRFLSEQHNSTYVTEPDIFTGFLPRGNFRFLS